MAYADEALKQSSAKQTLVRMKVGHRIDESWTATSAPIYSIVLDDTNIDSVYVSGVLGTEVSAVPSSDFEWRLVGNTFYIYVGSISPSIVVVIFYNKYFSTIKHEYLPSDPTLTGDAVEWSPRLDGVPSISESCDSLIDGVLTIDDTSISLINTDGLFSRMATYPMSLANKLVDIYSGINGVFKRVFIGKIQSFSTGLETCSMSIKSLFESLNQPAYFNDTLDECFHYYADNASLDPNKDGFPKSIIFERESELNIISNPTIVADRYPNPETMREAVCTDFNATPSTTVNRDWYICRMPFSTDELFDTDEVINPIGINHYATYTEFILLALPNVKVGEMIRVVKGASTYYGRVLFTLGSPPVIYTTLLTGLTSGSMTISRKGLNLCVSDAVNTYWIPYNLYSINTALTSGNNIYYTVTLADNFEATVGMTDPLDPQGMRVNYWFRINSTANLEVGSTIQRLIESSGLSVETTITNTKKVKFSLPYFGDYEYPTIQETVGTLLQNVGAGIGYNDDFNVKYFSHTIGSGSARNDSNISSFSASQDFQDIATSITFSNQHRTYFIVPSNVINTRNNYAGRYLDESDRSFTINHLLESGTDVDYKKHTIKKNTYQITTAIDKDSMLGDDINLSINQVFDDSLTASAKIVSRSNDGNSTKLILMDYE